MSYNNNVSSRYRPCMVDVDGKQEEALFHRWIERDAVYYEYDTKTPDMMMQDAYKSFTEDHIIARGICSIKKIREQAAIVELRSGDVKVVEPDKIKFLDTSELFDIFEEYFEKE